MILALTAIACFGLGVVAGIALGARAEQAAMLRVIQKLEAEQRKRWRPLVQGGTETQYRGGKVTP